MSQTLTVAVRHIPTGMQHLAREHCEPADAPGRDDIARMRRITQDEPDGHEYLVLVGIPGGKK